MDRVVTHRDGDMFTADLGGPHDAALCLPLLRGLDRRADAVAAAAGPGRACARWAAGHAAADATAIDGARPRPSPGTSCSCGSARRSTRPAPSSSATQLHDERLRRAPRACTRGGPGAVRCTSPARCEHSARSAAARDTKGPDPSGSAPFAVDLWLLSSSGQKSMSPPPACRRRRRPEPSRACRRQPPRW